MQHKLKMKMLTIRWNKLQSQFSLPPLPSLPDLSLLQPGWW